MTGSGSYRYVVIILWLFRGLIGMSLLIMWILCSKFTLFIRWVSGPRHELDFSAVTNLLVSYSKNGEALKKVTVENLQAVKTALLDLVCLVCWLDICAILIGPFPTFFGLRFEFFDWHWPLIPSVNVKSKATNLSLIVVTRWARPPWHRLRHLQRVC